MAPTLSTRYFLGDASMGMPLSNASADFAVATCTVRLVFLVCETQAGGTTVGALVSGKFEVQCVVITRFSKHRET